MSNKVERSDEKKSIFGLKLNGRVFFTSAFLIFLSIALTLIYKDSAKSFFNTTQLYVTENGGWFYILGVNFFLVFILYIAFSKYGTLKIGGEQAKPEFTKLSWFSMLFSAGMGIGLLYFSISEPLAHFSNPPFGEGGNAEAARQAMQYTYLHWGIHIWAVYALVGLSLAYFTYTRGLPLTLRSVFYPFLKEKIYGIWGDLIDIFAVLATLFGLATSLGYGVKQVSAGLNYVFDFPDTITTQVILIAAITLIATGSVVLGIHKGIKVLSKWNIIIALILLLLVLFLGPTLFIFKSYVQNIGAYLGNFIELSTWTETYSQDNWQMSWTVTYWGWWIAWSPFVGMFIARISKGRQIREFIFSVLFLPTLVIFFWMTAFGSTAINDVLLGDNLVLEAVNTNVDISLFAFFENYPFTLVLNLVAIILIVSFFVTSSDSGSLVIDSLTSGGKIDAPVGQRIFWAITEGAIAAVLLIGGGLEALQTASIVSALPFTVILFVMCYSLFLGLKEDFIKKEKKANSKRNNERGLEHSLKTDDKFSKNY
ncbi:choline/betaine glycine uptake protein BetT [Psychroflexus torquis ATCC 700755]|uniref:Choline/betaine glycine uptake protein BetT n=1 Tax=Psychroflexus torquis (strain ATCC 700755 / CIP 106069 / ACAM 623) TaxID=313595 RepID=K4IJ81_PSYTT|nr:BCCT family transporter [Psychroflexus torquis]AFU70409.1 choline/betaine glycine uptake protein BetT [Psychroflexus torquis ATCC 700755]